MRWIKYLSLLVGGLLLCALLIGLLWAAFQIFTHGQDENPEHLQAKLDYLGKISDLPQPQGRPNIVLILFDDLGYGDLGFTGSHAIATPTMDQLAAEGVVMNNFYSPAPVCTPARAGFLTGRLPLRAGMPTVVFPTGHPIATAMKLSDVNKRFPAEEITLADTLSAAGYATGMIGKWHLGDRSPSLPNDMGFDSFYGALYSNDMTPFALYRNREIEIEAPADQTRLNEHYGREARAFIEGNSEQPFFLYLAHNFPHIPLYRPADDVGRSKAGLYGDIIEGLDDLVGDVVETLKQQGVYDNTLILITSDNGPWFQGSPGSSRGRKADTFEGGMHVPMVAHWPAQLVGGKQLHGISMGTDWFPTILDWIDLPLPQDRIIDGKSLTTMLAGTGPSPNQYLYYFAGEELMAVRDARYKYHDKRALPYVQAGSRFAPGPDKGPWLFDMSLDFNESYDVSMLLPEEAQRLQDVLDDKREEMQQNRRGWIEQKK